MSLVKLDGGGLYPYNPDHAVGTCAYCGKEMIHNVPRMGDAGGFVHKHNCSFSCTDEGHPYQITQVTTASTTGTK